MNVAILGASNKPDRYSYKALQMLRECGHTPYPVHPKLEEIDGLAVYASLGEIPDPIDTITVYLAARNSNPIADQIVDAGARRVIFNPGAENPDLAERLRRSGSEPVDACTLVMLRTGQF